VVICDFAGVDVIRATDGKQVSDSASSQVGGPDDTGMGQVLYCGKTVTRNCRTTVVVQYWSTSNAQKDST
jgi:hypothetical protein